MNENTWYLRTQDETFGPESKEKLVDWAEMGRIQPGQEVSDDNLIWRRVEDVPFLDMRFSIDIGDGNPRGPFNRKAAEALLASGRLPPVAKLVEVREPFPAETEETPPPVLHQEGLPGLGDTVDATEAGDSEAAGTLRQAVAPVVEDAVPPADEEVPAPAVEEVPAPTVEEASAPVAEGTVSPVVEEVIAPAVDDSRVKELAALLEEARRHADELQVRLDAATKDLELQAETFRQKAESAAQEAAAELEAARQKSEIAAQDADARLATARSEGAAQLAEAEQKREAERKDAAEKLQALQQKLEAVQKDFAAQLEAARQKLALTKSEGAAELETVRKESEARLAEARQKAETEAAEAATRLAEAQKDAEARLAEVQRDAEARLAEVRQKAEAEVAETAAQLAETRQKAELVQKDADEREKKSREQIVALENELRRLPQAASEIADVQAAVYTIMTKEAAELAELIETEKREADEYRRRQQERADRLLERRRELLKRTGANIEDMTRKALVERPEDPRMVQLRREYEEFRRADEKKSREYEDKLLAKSREIEELRREISRRNVVDKDATQLQTEVVALREKLQRCEKDLLAERQLSEELRQRQATNQQVLMARLATLESPSIAPANTMHVPETRQSREAKSVRLPRWMQLGGKR